MSLNTTKGEGSDVVKVSAARVTQSVPSNMNKSVIRGALLKYKTLVPAGAGACSGSLSSTPSVVVTSEFSASGSSNPPPPPLLTSNKPSLPRKPRRSSTTKPADGPGEEFGSDLMSSSKIADSNSEPSETDTSATTDVTNANATVTDLTRKSILHIRRKSGSIGYVNPIAIVHTESNNTTAAESVAVDAANSGGNSIEGNCSSTSNSSAASTVRRRVGSLPGSTASALLENMFGRRRASLLGGGSADPSSVIPVTTPTVDDDDYSELNTLAGRIRILELHNMFAGQMHDQSNNSGADITIKVLGEYGLKKCDTVPDSYTDCSKSMKNRLLIREGVCEKLNRSDQWEPYHFILTHNALVYCIERSTLGVSTVNTGSTGSNSGPNSPEGRRASITAGIEQRLSYHRTLPLDTLIVA